MLREFAKYAFFGLKRKRRDFEHSVLMYVSIKIPALTHSGWKSRVCVNTLDRLSPRTKERTLCILLHAHKVSRPLQALKGAPIASSASVFKPNTFILGKKIQKSYRLDNQIIRMSYHACT